MNIPDLPPDLSFPKLGTSPEDQEFAFEVKRAAIGPYIIQRWGWDDNFQRDVHDSRYREKPFYMVRRGEKRLGTLSFQVLAGHIQFGEFYLFPIFQREGTGAKILAHCLKLADSLALSVRLEHLHWNPVRSLYKRHGFVDVGRSDIHCFMERPVAVKRPASDG